MSGKDEHNLLPKQRKFADLYLTGMYGGQALREAGYQATRPDKGAYKMLQRPEIRDYIRAQRQELAQKSALDREKVVHWLCRVILTPIGTAEKPADRDLLESEHHQTYKNGRTTRRIRMVNKMAAIRLLCHLMGWTTPQQDQKQSDLTELANMVRRARQGNAPQK